MSVRSHPPFLATGLAGAWVIRGLDGDANASLIRTAAAQLRGDVGGLDVMPPNDDGESWLFVGRWTDCMDAAVQSCIADLDRGLRQALELVRNGVFPRGGGEVDVRVSASTSAASVAAYEYAHGIAPVEWWTWSASELERLQSVFAGVPGWIGVHMGMPHWLGVGMDKDGDRIRSFTPYARLATVAGQGIEISAMAESHALDAWLAALGRATRWW